MRRWFRRPVVWLAVVFSVGAFRDAWFHLVHEPLRVEKPPRIGSAYEPLRPFLAGVPRIDYVTDEPLDADPAAPRQHDRADVRYARAQYALAPVILVAVGTSSAWLLADFEHPRPLETLLATGGYLLVDRAAPGIALLRRK